MIPSPNCSGYDPVGDKAIGNRQRRGATICYYRAMPSTRRFPPPWSIEERQESFIVKDANGQSLAYLYFENEPQRQLSTRRDLAEHKYDVLI